MFFINLVTLSELSYPLLQVGWSVDSVHAGEQLAIIRLLLQLAAFCQKEGREDQHHGKRKNMLNGNYVKTFQLKTIAE
jgi:hypothetical protein